MTTQWRTGMKLTKARLDVGSSFAWASQAVITGGHLRNAYGDNQRAGDKLTPARMNS